MLQHVHPALLSQFEAQKSKNVSAEQSCLNLLNISCDSV